MLNWLAEVITLPRVIAFVLGMIVCEIIGLYINKRRVRKGLPAKQSTFNVVIGVVVILTLLWIMITTQQARNCAININISVSREQEAATIERNSFQHAIQESLSLPPEIQALPTNDPRRKALTDPITAEYLKQLSIANEVRKNNQAALDKARKSCGQE
jgi:predicted PurR-regulated permease PerM